MYRIPIPASGSTYTSTHSVSCKQIYLQQYFELRTLSIHWASKNRPLSQVFQDVHEGLTLIDRCASCPAVNTPDCQTYTLVQGPSEGNKFFLAYQYSSTGYNFQSYYIQFDLCTSRTGGQHLGGICPSCPTGYYLSEVNVANNQCYPDGWGIRSSTQTLVPCADTNCLECPTSSTVCRKCKQTPTQYWSQGTDPTTCVTTAPASRFGIDSTGFRYVGCSDANCLNCAASNTVCTGCDVANGWYLDGTVCKTKAQFNANQGVDIDTGTSDVMCSTQTA